GGGVEDRVLQAGLALGGQQLAVDRRADRLPQRQLVGRPVVQGRYEAVGPAGRLPVVVEARVGADEAVLQVGDVVTGPVDLPGEQRAQRARVGRVHREEDLRDLHLGGLPVAG